MIRAVITHIIALPFTVLNLILASSATAILFAALLVMTFVVWVAT